MGLELLNGVTSVISLHEQHKGEIISKFMLPRVRCVRLRCAVEKEAGRSIGEPPQKNH